MSHLAPLGFSGPVGVLYFSLIPFFAVHLHLFFCLYPNVPSLLFIPVHLSSSLSIYSSNGVCPSVCSHFIVHVHLSVCRCPIIPSPFCRLPIFFPQKETIIAPRKGKVFPPSFPLKRKEKKAIKAHESNTTRGKERDERKIRM